MMIIFPFGKKRHRKHAMCSACKSGHHDRCGNMHKCCCGTSMNECMYCAGHHGHSPWRQMAEHVPWQRVSEMFPWLKWTPELDHNHDECPVCAKHRGAEHKGNHDHESKVEHAKHWFEHQYNDLRWNTWKPNIAILIVMLISSGRFSALLRKIKP